LSCSNDNLNPLAEDVNYSQALALKNAVPIDIDKVQSLTLISPIDEVQGIDPGQSTINTTASFTVSGVGSMKVTNIPYGSYAWSSEVCFDFTKIREQNAKNASYEFSCSVPTNAVGSFGITGARIDCGIWRLEGGWQGLGGIMTTTAFAGKDAREICCTSFYGRCNGTGTGGVGCSYTMSSCTGLQYYTY